MAYKNKADQVAASKKHYQANKQYYLERNQRYRKQLTEYVNNLKETTPCSDCGEHYPYYVMDFDHLDSNTKSGLVSFFTKRRSINALMAEIPKCEIVCSNCHRVRTFNRLQKQKNSIR